jgi:hypothetical protein
LKANRTALEPIYRSYLAGGPEAFRLTPHGAGVVLTLALAGHLLAAGIPVTAAQAADLLLAIAGPLLVATVAARWLGSRRGLLTGVALAASHWCFQVSGSGPLDRLLDLSIWVGLAAFAVANIPGRLDVLDRPWTRCVFWAALAATCALTGGVGPVYLLSILSLYLVASQDSRGARFLRDGHGLLFIAAVIGCLATIRHAHPPAIEGPTAPLGELVAKPLLAGLPWTPLALWGLFLVFREGYCFVPFWRLLACWAVAPIGLLLVGLFRDTAHLSVILPALAVLAAVGFDDLLYRVRRAGWFTRRPATA